MVDDNSRINLRQKPYQVANFGEGIVMKGLDFYASRADKAYSLVDCISMDTMRQMGLAEVLTNDHHFTQEGFTILIKR